MAHNPAPPIPPTALIILDDGTILKGFGFGAETSNVGEICFNTAMTGYQEVLTDPSYAGQIITFTFPHIGNVGTNDDDNEAPRPVCRGLITRERPTAPSNWRSTRDFDDYLKDHRIPGIYGIDTRALTRRIRTQGAPNGVIAVNHRGHFDVGTLLTIAREWPGLNGMDLAKDVSRTTTDPWDQGYWRTPPANPATHHVVAIDYGAKENILRSLVHSGCRVTIVPCTTDAQTILALNPDGVFLSNGPGDPAATGVYAVPVIQTLLDRGVPIFGICLGHQLLALALGAKTKKMPLGHRGANHPVKNLITGLVEITSQNHGFCVLPETLPADVTVTHVSLFDGSNEGLEAPSRRAFSVQYHPEASPGPHDARYLFKKFITLMTDAKHHTENTKIPQRAQR